MLQQHFWHMSGDFVGAPRQRTTMLPQAKPFVFVSLFWIDISARSFLSGSLVQNSDSMHAINIFIKYSIGPGHRPEF
jgi:hypothetical protein